MALGTIISIGYRRLEEGRTIGMLALKSVLAVALFGVGTIYYSGNALIELIVALVIDLMLTGVLALACRGILRSSKHVRRAFAIDVACGLLVAISGLGFRLLVPAFVASFAYTILMLVILRQWIREPEGSLSPQ